MKWICADCGVGQDELHMEGCEYFISKQTISDIVQEKGFDKDKLRLNIGGGDQKYSNCLSLDLEPSKMVHADIYGDITKGLPYIEGDTFNEILFIHVIEHIERKNHPRVFDEIWRMLKPGCRLILAYPDIIENMKRFLDNKYGGRESMYHNTIFGRQAYRGDFHVSGIWREYITDKLINSGFVDIKYIRHTINTTITAIKGEKLKTFLE